MADFSSLKQTIQTYIKQNGNEEITGNILQDVLLAMVSTMGDSAINALASALQDEITARQNQDATLQGNISAEATARQQADTALGGRIDGLQTAINGINTKLAEGYIYAGIATPSTNPRTPSGKVFYIAVSSGTYTNFSNLTVAQGINILKYNGSSWSKDVVYAIDARPKKNSQNFVTSGGIFDNMGALDVSELNATENPHTPALYADLSAALAAIPTDYQKGGMSVKFVQSNDNKYVQWRLIADEWSTNTDDWAIAGEGVYVDNPEFVEVKVDSEERMLEARKNDGTKVEYNNAEFEKNVKIKGSLNVEGEEGEINASSVLVESARIKDEGVVVFESYAFEDPESRMSVEMDAEEKMISYRDREGTLHENAGIVTSSLFFSDPNGEKTFVEKTEYDGKECVVRDMALLYPVETYKSVFENYRIGGFQADWGPGVHNNLSLLWFTDVHESTKNLTRIKAFYDVYKGYFNDAVVTGDILSNFNDDFNFWTEIGLKNVLMVMGNHDPETVYSGDPNVRETVTEQDAYERFFKPFLNDTDIVYEENKAYWYKDYPTIISADCEGGVRLIGLHQEPNWSGDEQMEWLQERLGECLAKGNRKAVIIAVHGPFMYNSGYPCTDVNCSFNSFYKIPTGTTYISNDMLSAVQDFIDAGGEFICWMGGHTHQDWFVQHSVYTDQILIILGTASYKHTFRQERMLANTKSMDRFNIFSVDPVNKHIRLFRIGIDMDIYGRHVGGLVYDYHNKTLISNF